MVNKNEYTSYTIISIKTNDKKSEKRVLSKVNEILKGNSDYVNNRIIVNDHDTRTKFDHDEFSEKNTVCIFIFDDITNEFPIASIKELIKDMDCISRIELKMVDEKFEEEKGECEMAKEIKKEEELFDPMVNDTKESATKKEEVWKNIFLSCPDLSDLLIDLYEEGGEKYMKSIETLVFKFKEKLDEKK